MFFFKCCNPKKAKINNDLKKEFIEFSNNRIEFLKSDNSFPEYYKRQIIRSYKNAIDSIINNTNLRSTCIDIIELDMEEEKFKRFSDLLNGRSLSRNMSPI